MTGHGFSATHAQALLRAREVGRDPEAQQFGVANFLYAHWYTLGQVEVTLEPWWPPLEGMLRVAQVEALGWRPAVVVRRGMGGVAVARDASGRARAVLRGGYAHTDGSSRAGLPLEVGDDVVAVPRSGGVMSEGWWRTWGGGWDPRVGPDDARRVYISPDVARLPDLVGCLTAALEARGDPWLVKSATEAQHLGRPDAVVVYVRDRAAFDDIVDCARDKVRHDPGPPLTEGLAPGVAWADDPGDGRSFGESRCEVIADALARTDDDDGDAFLAATAELFRAAGLDPAAPHLREGTHG